MLVTSIKDILIEDDHAQFVETFNVGAVCQLDGTNFMVPAGIYKPVVGSSTELMWNSLKKHIESRAQPTQRLLEIGTGSGAIAILLKKRYRWMEVDATDISEGACATAACNALLHNVQIQIAKGDVWEPVKHFGTLYDGIVFNIPLMDKILESPHELALCDPHGTILYRFISGLHEYLRPDGFALFLHASFSAPLPDLTGRVQILQEIPRPENNVIRSVIWSPDP